MRSFKVNDPRTSVIEVLLETQKNTGGDWDAVAYHEKGTNITRIANSSNRYNYVGFERTEREDVFYAIREDGDKQMYVIATDGLREGLQQNLGYTMVKTNQGNDKPNEDAQTNNDSSSDNKDKSSCLMKIIKAPFKLLWWLIKLILSIVTFGLLSGFFKSDD